MFNKENKKNMAVDNSVAGSNRIVAGTKIKGEVNSGADFRIDTNLWQTCSRKNGCYQRKYNLYQCRCRGHDQWNSGGKKYS